MSRRLLSPGEERVPSEAGASGSHHLPWALAIRLKPDDADSFNNRGIARRAKGDLDGALLDYSEAIRLKPDYAAAFYNRGNARSDKGDLDGALLDYDKAVSLGFVAAN